MQPILPYRNFGKEKINFCQYFTSYLSYFPAPLKKISEEITYTMLFKIFIFGNIFKLKLLPKFDVFERFNL